jgi:hypothetical protein
MKEWIRLSVSGLSQTLAVVALVISTAIVTVAWIYPEVIVDNKKVWFGIWAGIVIGVAHLYKK